MQLEWPAAIDANLRYFANTGGRMPRATLDLLHEETAALPPALFDVMQKLDALR